MHISHTCQNITGTASMDPKSNGKVSAVCFLYIMITNTMPTIIGSILVVAIKPGIHCNSIPPQLIHFSVSLHVLRCIVCSDPYIVVYLYFGPLYNSFTQVLIQIYVLFYSYLFFCMTMYMYAYRIFVYSIYMFQIIWLERINRTSITLRINYSPINSNAV